jgi:hypothetical protein
VVRFKSAARAGSADRLRDCRSRPAQFRCALATTGNCRSRQASIPPASGLTLLIPNLFNLSATRALEISFGQEQ